MTCECGCGCEAVWLCTGWSPEGGFKDAPCCENVAAYLADACAEFDVPFSRRRARPPPPGAGDTGNDRKDQP